MAGKLSIVATPIGNLSDITLRALETLKAADLILAEDTRVTKKLLERYGIEKPLLSYHQHSGKEKATHIRALLAEGKHLALVTDAGTPGISDPGGILVSEARKQGLGTTIESIPGPSALTSALSIAGVPADSFLFLGFLPHKKGRETLFREIAGEKRTVVFYESSHRILKTLESLTEKLTAEHKVTIARELTKIHEEGRGGTPQEILEHYQNHPDKIRGEFTVLVSQR